ncbi:hypothetical protein GCM10010252_33610 [Streptomyces aureoverticillatus]|nr:hypothetical protein GCM10010252_33610 [Streptomyces aureoverticillatus]
MNVDKLVRDALQEQAAEQDGPRGDLAGRVLTTRRRRRTRAIAGAALGTAAVVAAAVGVTALGSDGSGGDDPRPATRPDGGGVIAHPDQAVPRDFVAAGNVGMAGYAVSRDIPQKNGDSLLVRQYFLLNPATKKYEKADAKWAWAAVAPGMRTAAVLEGELPARRIGMLDLRTGEVTRWITTERPVAAVEWSPDGKRLLATAYSKNPDRLIDRPGDHEISGPQPHLSRTGFFVIDAGSGEVGPFRPLPQPRAEKDGYFPGLSREDMHWNRDGTRLFVMVYEGPRGANYRDWYTPSGAKTSAPPGERHTGWPRAGLSPDGKLLADDSHARTSAIRDPRTGKEVARVPSQEQLAWADSKRLVALACDPARCTGDAFGMRLVVVTVGSKKAVPLTAIRKSPEGYKRLWSPMLTTR